MALAGPSATQSVAPELLTQRLVYILRLLDREASRTLDAECGIRILDWRILAALAVESPLAVRSMASILSISRSEASRSAAFLVEQGLVLRQEDAEDRRSAWFFITAKGRDVYRRVMPLREEFMQRVVEPITLEDRAAFDRILGQLTAHLEQII